MRLVPHHGPESSYGPVTPLVILIALLFLFPAVLLGFVTFMASWPAR